MLSVRDGPPATTPRASALNEHQTFDSGQDPCVTNVVLTKVTTSGEKRHGKKTRNAMRGSRHKRMLSACQGLLGDPAAAHAYSAASAVAFTASAPGES